jgi:hypothetical protein
MIDHADIMDVRGKEIGGHFHAVRFYDSEMSLCRIVAGFLREGLALGQPALVIATKGHAQGISRNSGPKSSTSRYSPRRTIW